MCTKNWPSSIIIKNPAAQDQELKCEDKKAGDYMIAYKHVRVQHNTHQYLCSMHVYKLTCSDQRFQGQLSIASTKLCR